MSALVLRDLLDVINYKEKIVIHTEKKSESFEMWKFSFDMVEDLLDKEVREICTGNFNTINIEIAEGI